MEGNRVITEAEMLLCEVMSKAETKILKPTDFTTLEYTESLLKH